MSEAALAVIESKDKGVGTLMRQATDVAGVCREVVKRTARNIQGRQYVQVEGWQSIAVAYGCVASARDVERIPGGVRAIGEVRRMSDGAVVSTAEGFVGEDEATWFGGKDPRTGKDLPKRADYAIRAMAQTRAISRACRSAFAFVVTLIDSNLQTTPAEEVPDGGFSDSPASPSQTVAEKAARVREVLTAARQVVEQPKASPPRSAPVSGLPTTFPNFGRAKGAPIAGASEKDLEFYASAARRSLEDLSKAKWHDKERAMLAAIEVEQERQRNASGQGEDGPPPHSDEDAPF